MIVNKGISMNVVYWLALCILIPATVAFPAESGKGVSTQPADLSAFLQTIGKKASNFKTLKTEFIQEKKMVMFKDKLILRGRIYLEKPNLDQ